MKTGWICLHRQLIENEDYFREPFTKMMAWIDLLLTANYKPSKIHVRGIEVKVGVGQIATSSKALSKRWQWSHGKVDRYLN